MSKYNGSFDIPDVMRGTIESCARGLGVAGIGGGLVGPGADLVVIAPTWIGMTIALADQAGHNLDKQTAKKLALAVVAGAGMFMGGTKIASTGIAWLTAPFTFGLSLAVSAAANAALNLTFTKAYGRAAARFFLQTTDISDTDVAVKILIALIGIDLGVHTGYEYLIQSA